MALNTLRPAPNSNVIAVANGQTISSAMVNGWQNSMNYLAGRGAVIKTLTETRLNGQIQIPLGVVSRGQVSPNPIVGNTFVLDKKALIVPVWLNAGYDTLDVMFNVRLNSMKAAPSAPLGYVGSSFRISLVRGGDSREMVYLTWRDMLAPQYVLQEGFFKQTIPIGSLFRLSPVHVEQFFLKLEYSAVEGYDYLVGQPTQGTLSNPTWWNGCSFFSCAVYKSIIPC